LSYNGGVAKTNTPKMTDYSEIYKEQCFLAWYAAGRPTLVKKLEEILPEDEYKRKAAPITFWHWRNENGWDVRADYLDARVIKEAEDSIVQSKILMLKEIAARARKMSKQGEEYLDENGFDSSASAVQAIVKGAELERQSRGMSAALMKVLELDDDGLKSETQRLVERLLESGETIDVAEIPVEDDAESED